MCSSYWICPGVGGRARSRRGQCWTASRVCTLFSFRNDPPEESRSPCVARARGELGDGVCFRTCSRGVGATGVNEPPRSFGERFLFDQELASFDERFAGADISVAETEDGESNVLNYAHLPSPGPGEHAIAQPASGVLPSGPGSDLSLGL